MNDWTSRRNSVHWAAQLASAAGATLLPARDDFGHTNLGWSDDLGALVGRTLPGGKAVALRPRDLALIVTGADVRLSLEGRTLDHGLAWLSDQLEAELELPDHDLPEPPERFGSGVQELGEWFATAHAQVTRVADGREVRCWPHHFDLATRITLDPEMDAEDARSIGVGMTPGDDSYARPYWYVTPWPYPDADALPDLPDEAAWHTEGWTGAVLVDEREAAAIGAFLPAAIDACRGLLQHGG